MQEEYVLAVFDAIRRHANIRAAAVTGSRARRTGLDEFSDLDLLLVADDSGAVRDVHAWLPQPERIALCAFHLSHYCSVMIDGFDRIDFAIHSAEDAAANWVVHDYQVIKGDATFAALLAAAARDAVGKKAAHLSADACVDNVLLLLVTALERVKRGELLSAHSFLSTAGDMVLALERRHGGVEKGADLLDPRRRIEHGNAALARVLHDSLFVAPAQGIRSLTDYLSHRQWATSTPQQLRVLAYLSGG